MIIFPFQHYFFFFLELISVAFRFLSLYIYHEVIPKASPSSVNFLTFYQCHHLQEVFPVAPSLLLLRSAGHLSLSMPGSSVVLSLGSGAFFLPHPQLVYAIILHSSPLSWKGHLFWVLILEGLVRLHRAIQLQLLRHYWLGHRLGLLCYWMVCPGNKQRSFCHFWECIQVLHFRLLLTMRATPFLPRDSCPL